MTLLPGPTGTTIRMGGVFTAYTNTTPVSGTNIIRLNATLGPLRTSPGPIAANATTQLSLSFADQNVPFTYPG